MAWGGTALAVGLALVLRARAISVGWMLDDYAQLAYLEHEPPVARARWDLFSFVRSGDELHRYMELGRIPWWTDPEMRLAFFRPLSSWLAAADHALFGVDPLGPHLHSLLWLAALLVVAGILFRSQLGLRNGTLALLGYALEEGLTLPVGWICNRNALVASALALGALYRSRRGSRRDRALSIVLFALALLAGEYAIAALGYFAAFAFFDSRARRAGPRVEPAPAGSRPPAARWSFVAIMLALAAGYVVLHRALGYGAKKFPFYVDPFGQPLRFVPWSFAQATSLLGDLALGRPAGAPPPLVTLAAAVLVTIVLARLAPRSRPLLAGALLSLVPLSAALAGPRMLVLPAIGFAAAIGEALASSVAIVSSASRALLARAGAALLAACVVFVHAVQGPRRAFRELGEIARTNQARLRAMLAAPLDDAEAPRERWVLLSVADPTTLLYFQTVRHLFGHALPRGFFVLTTTPGAQLLTRTASDEIELRSPRSGLFGSPLAAVMRPADEGLAQGETIAAGGLRITVAERGKLGPSTLRVRFDAPADDRSLRFLIVTPKGYERFTLPPIGETVAVPPAADPQSN